MATLALAIMLSAFCEMTCSSLVSNFSLERSDVSRPARWSSTWLSYDEDICELHWGSPDVSSMNSTYLCPHISSELFHVIFGSFAGQI